VKECRYLERSHTVIRNGTIDRDKFLLTFQSNYGPILHRFRDITPSNNGVPLNSALRVVCLRDTARYWSKIATFSNTLAFDATRGRRPNIAITFGSGKLDMVKKFENMFTRFDTRHERDRSTTRRDRRTDTARRYKHSVAQQKYTTLVLGITFANANRCLKSFHC